MRLRTNNDHGHDDDDSSAPAQDVGSWVWSASHDAHSGLLPFDFAKGAKPGGGGGGPPGGGGGGGTLLASYTSGDPGEYNINVVFQGGNWTTALQHAFIVAADQLSDYIIGDIPNEGAIDDITIYASVVRIDGPGRILGQAGPTDLRAGSFLPDTAIMQFDVADATNYDGMGLFDDIVIHEMLHSIGFGTIWSDLHLLAGAGTPNPTFTGSQAVAAYHLVYPLAGNIPVEQDGGAGTRDSHWDEQTFGNEIMTGYINASNDLSYMTVASLGDLGYTLDPTLSGATFTSPIWI
jgi:Leishmanolysin